MVYLGISGFILLLAFGLFIYSTLRNREILRRLNEMLDAASKGEFREETIDESLISQVESRMVHYLSASQEINRQLQGERDKIKALIGDISHQTKTPLSNILLYAELLKEAELPEESQVCVVALNKQAQKLAVLIDTLVKTSRLETGVFTLHPRDFGIQTLFEGVMDAIRLKAEAKGVKVAYEKTELKACFDLKWMAEALYNIVDNGVKYTPEGGTIHLSAKRYEFFVRIDVKDNGIGIKEEEQPKIFGRFYRSPEVSESEGVGIGLYLARQIVTNQGGYMKVSSKVGKGSTFSVFLPIYT